MSNRLLCCASSLDGGGSERQLWQLATRIDPAQFEPQVYLLYRRGHYLEQLPEELPVHAFWEEGRSRRSYVPGQIHRRQVSHLRQVIEREKIGVVYDRTYHMTLITAAACRASGVARVSVIVSPPSRDFAHGEERFRWFKRRLLARAYGDPASMTLAVSEAVADDASSFYGLRRESLQVVPSPIDTTTVRAMASENIAVPLDPAIDLRIAVIGRLSAEKGQQTALAAVAELHRLKPGAKIQLHLVGAGPDQPRLQNLVQELGLQSSVRFHGFQANPYPWIKRADLVCIPSRYEGLPNVLLEAMAIGTPVLATRCNAAMTELMGADQSRGKLTAVDDPRQMAERFAERMADPKAWLDRARRAEAWVVERHNFPRWLDQMQTLLQKSLKLPGRGPLV